MEATETRGSGVLETRRILQGFFGPRPVIYWTDMGLSAVVGWSAVVVASVTEPSAASFWPWVVVGVLAMYRAVLFIHEITHLKAQAVPGFELAWNLLVGIPMLVPSFAYVGVHNDHHRRRTYGTPQDPEYLPLGTGPRWRIVLFAIETVIIPLLFGLRFLVVGPVSWFVPPLRRFVERHASSLVINPAYVRKDPTAEERRRMFASEAAALVIWIAAFFLAARGIVPWQAFAVWYFVSMSLGFINQIRTLGAHAYRNLGGEMTVDSQVEDSVTIPGSWWTELWAPVGLRYHALHHFLSDLPYHALGAAHRKLMEELPEDAPYRRAVQRSLPHALGALWRGAGRGADPTGSSVA